MKTADTTTTPLLALLALSGLTVALLARSWAADRTGSLLMQALTAGVAYAAAVWVLARLAHVAYARTLASSLHLLAVPVIAGVVLAAVAVSAAEQRAVRTDGRPAWGVLSAQLVQHGIAAMRTAVAA